MSSEPKGKQLNFNTVLIFIIGGLVSFGIRKMDEVNTEVVKVGTSQAFIVQRIDSLETKMSQMVLQRDFESEIKRLNRELDELRKSR